MPEHACHMRARSAVTLRWAEMAPIGSELELFEFFVLELHKKAGTLHFVVTNETIAQTGGHTCYNFMYVLYRSL